ncbi:DUF3073 domain-containing protein [Actinobacteria bacterium YIM 96077]|uniref:DUF3073 domain-containing protein n=1 Tax=Phytoactinopolyspora halophila TaxID=1981511 RepID=A0A329QH80_9ACTN|nr:DUF3073 domain-containing protein [Phytoactinopolyspora halophila]AYY15692.1 DUF3073 domain-containing protein [Actinobacteria bacterium YIM 96077]RAW11660.1 DUF3073 domain-containing protein [Phytoactinopolyspora halophila]
MGRGRAKAKQTKVARRLKYQTFETDFEALQRELRGEDPHGQSDDYEADYYADYDDDEGDEPSRRVG